MSLLVLVGAALGLGFVVLALAGSRRPPVAGEHGNGAADGAAGAVATPELGWLGPLGAAGLERLLLALFGEMGFEPGPPTRREDGVEFEAVNPAPIRGGRLRVLGLLGRAAVDADAVRAFLDAARADGASKAVLVTTGRFAEDARGAARDAPIDLVDGPALAALVKRHLPQAWATRQI